MLYLSGSKIKGSEFLPLLSTNRVEANSTKFHFLESDNRRLKINDIKDTLDYRPFLS